MGMVRDGASLYQTENGLDTAGYLDTAGIVTRSEMGFGLFYHKKAALDNEESSSSLMLWISAGSSQNTEERRNLAAPEMIESL